MTEAARRMELPRRTLVYRMARLGLRPRRNRVKRNKSLARFLSRGDRAGKRHRAPRARHSAQRDSSNRQNNRRNAPKVCPMESVGQNDIELITLEQVRSGQEGAPANPPVDVVFELDPSEWPVAGLLVRHRVGRRDRTPRCPPSAGQCRASSVGRARSRRSPSVPNARLSRTSRTPSTTVVSLPRTRNSRRTSRCPHARPARPRRRSPQETPATARFAVSDTEPGSRRTPRAVGA